MSWETRGEVDIGNIFDTATTRCGWNIDNSPAKLVNTECPSCHLRNSVCDAIKMTLNSLAFFPLVDRDNFFFF